MAQCECGRPIGASGKLCARCDALRTLGLERGASRNEIRDTYRDLVKVWHPDRFSNDGKLHSRAEERLKEVNEAFQRLNSSLQNSSGDATAVRAATATKKPQARADARTPYWTSKTATRTSQWYSASARDTSRWSAWAQERPWKDVSAADFPNAVRPQSNGSARTQAPAREASRPVHAAFWQLNSSLQNSSGDTTPARAASATKKPEAKAEARKLCETFETSRRTSQWSSAFQTETARLNAPAQESCWKNLSRLGFLSAADPEPSGNARTQSPTAKANHPGGKGAPGVEAQSAWFSLRGMPYLPVLALIVAFTQMWVNVHMPPTAAQDAILNQYYETEAGKNAFSRPTVQDEIMNLYYETEARKNAGSQLESAPTQAVAPFSSAAPQKQDIHLPLKRSNINAESDSLRPDARIPVPARRNRVLRLPNVSPLDGHSGL